MKLVTAQERYNIPADRLPQSHCGVIVHKEMLYELHNRFCYPGITRLSYFVKVRNLPYFMDGVKQVCADRLVCARWNSHL